MKARIRVWMRRVLMLLVAGILLVVFVLVPVGGSFLITNARFPERPASPPVSLPVEDVEFVASDGVRLDGWWIPQTTDDIPKPTIIFLHGLNNSRQEMVDRAMAAWEHGFSTLLFDLRNHGESADAYTTLGVRESRDVCAAAGFVRTRQGDTPLVLWGVSLGASTALLGAECARATAVISDSSFLSFEETVKHHFRRIFHLPSFPIADLLILLTRVRMDFSLQDGDVEAAVRRMPDIPILFIAGGEDWRMPPELARQLRAASGHPESQLLVIEAASHGRAFREDPDRYLDAVMAFLEVVLP